MFSTGQPSTIRLLRRVLAFVLGLTFLGAALAKAIDPWQASIFAGYTLTGGIEPTAWWGLLAITILGVEAWIGFVLLTNRVSRPLLIFVRLMLVLFSLALVRGALDTSAPSCGCFGPMFAEAQREHVVGIVRNAAFWEEDAEDNPSHFRGSTLTDTAFPSRKGLLLDVLAGRFDETEAREDRDVAYVGLADGSARADSWNCARMAPWGGPSFRHEKVWPAPIFSRQHPIAQPNEADRPAGEALKKQLERGPSSPDVAPRWWPGHRRRRAAAA